MSKSKKVKVEQSIHFIGVDKKHVLETILESKDAPEIVSVGTVKIPDTNQYVSFTLTTKGNKVVKFEVGEPNIKLIAEDEAKIAFVNNFITYND